MEQVDDASTPRTCLNCGAALHGEYCHECGQRDIDPRASLWSVLGEFIQESLEVDGRLPRTLVPFLFRPGHLAREFLEGRRAQYTSPVRLYIFAALVSFFLMQSASQDVLEGEDFVVTNDGIKVAGDERTRAQLTAGTAEIQEIEDARGLADEDQVVSLAVADEAIPERYRGLSNENLARAAIRDFFGWAPLGAVLLVVAFAAMLKLFYFRVPVLTHVVNSTHIHGFGLLLFAIAAFTERGWFILGALVAIQVYVFVALLKAYEQAWWLTMLKYFALVVLYGIISTLAFTAVFLAATQLG